MPQREMTAKERRAIRKLVIDECANYDAEYGCLPLDCACYMLGKVYTGNFCKWFETAVLPLDKALMASLNHQPVKNCKHCGKAFPINGRQMYCSDSCREAGNRAANAARVRKHRLNVMK